VFAGKVERESSRRLWKTEEGDGGEVGRLVGRWGERAENNDVNEKTLSVLCISMVVVFNVSAKYTDRLLLNILGDKDKFVLSL
jgi:hypothetical protein